MEREATYIEGRQLDSRVALWLCQKLFGLYILGLAHTLFPWIGLSTKSWYLSGFLPTLGSF